MTVVERARELIGVVAALRDEVAAEGTCTDLVMALRRVMDQVDLTLVGAVAGLGDTTAFGELGYANAGAWMADQCGSFASEPSARERQGFVLSTLPRFAAALSDGRIGMAHLKVLVPAIKTERLTLAIRDELVLLQSALTLDPHRFGVLVRQWAALCDDELHDPSDSDAVHRRRTLRLHQLPDGTWRLEGVLDPLAGEAMAAALEACMGERSADDDRTPGQRRHDAMADLMIDRLGDPSRTATGRSRPQVTVVLQGDTAVTGGGVVLPDHLRDMVCCDATFTPVWMTPTGVPFDVGTPESSVPIRNRRAVVARDGCCRYPGCARSARWTDVHHLHHRCKGGRHQISNLVLLCRFHHRLVHRENIRTWLDGDELTLVIEWPSGKVLRSPPAPSLIS